LVNDGVPPLGDVIGAFKSLTTVEYVRGVKTKLWSGFQQRLWQRNYFDHVIRDVKDLDRRATNDVRADVGRPGCAERSVRAQPLDRVRRTTGGHRGASRRRPASTKERTIQGDEPALARGLDNRTIIVVIHQSS
jgi:hypothetical protein